MIEKIKTVRTETINMVIVDYRSIKAIHTTMKEHHGCSLFNQFPSFHIYNIPIF